MAETRTRRTQSAKSEQTETENTEAADRKAEAEARKAEKDAERQAQKEKREAEKKEREEKREQEKAERDAKKAEEKEQREKEREAAKAAKAEEKAAKLQEQIDSGDLIFADWDRNQVEATDVNGDWEGFTYTVAEPKKEEVAQRALAVITDLQEKATEVPYPGKELADEYGGGTVQWVAFFGMLRVLGMVKAYRFKTGERGQSGLAYLWIGPTEPYTLESAGEIAEATEEVEAAA